MNFPFAINLLKIRWGLWEIRGNSYFQYFIDKILLAYIWCLEHSKDLKCSISKKRRVLYKNTWIERWRTEKHSHSIIQLSFDSILIVQKLNYIHIFSVFSFVCVSACVCMCVLRNNIGTAPNAFWNIKNNKFTWVYQSKYLEKERERENGIVK